MIQGIDAGELKIYKQKHAARELDGAASLIAAHMRGKSARYAVDESREQEADEAEVDEYHRQKRLNAAQKQYAFKPRYPPSYYRGAAALIQRRAKANGLTKSQLPELPKPLVVYRPRVPNSKLRSAVTVIQAVLRGDRARRAHVAIVEAVNAVRSQRNSSNPSSPRSNASKSPRRASSPQARQSSPVLQHRSSPAGLAKPEASTPDVPLVRARALIDHIGPQGQPELCAGEALLVPAKVGPQELSVRVVRVESGRAVVVPTASQLYAIEDSRARVLASFEAGSEGELSATAGQLLTVLNGSVDDGWLLAAIVDNSDAMDARARVGFLPADAEDKFLLADTSGDGYVDEEELLVLIRDILEENGVQELPPDESVRAFLRTFRAEPNTPLNLGFDEFVSVYNAIGAAMDNGDTIG